MKRSAAYPLRFGKAVLRNHTNFLKARRIGMEGYIVSKNDLLTCTNIYDHK